MVRVRMSERVSKTRSAEFLAHFRGVGRVFCALRPRNVDLCRHSCRVSERLLEPSAWLPEAPVAGHPVGPRASGLDRSVQRGEWPDFRLKAATCPEGCGRVGRPRRCRAHRGTWREDRALTGEPR